MAFARLASAPHEARRAPPKGRRTQRKPRPNGRAWQASRSTCADRSSVELIDPTEVVRQVFDYDPRRRDANVSVGPLVQLESRTIVLLQQRILGLLLEHAVADHEQVKLVTHEAAE